MKTTNILLLIIPLALLSGCMAPQRSVMTTPAYEARPSVATSLFTSDQAVLGDDAVARILSSKLELPARARLAIMKFPDNQANVWRPYWRDEEYLKLQQSQVETLSGSLLASDQIAEAIPLPSLMTPQQVSIPILREAALRMQADLLLIFRVGTDNYSQYRAFAKDKAKAYSTCELVLLDIRTGLVPFTRIISRERLEEKQPTDLDLSETMRRAEQASSAEALKSAAQDLVVFAKSVPRKKD